MMSGTNPRPTLFADIWVLKKQSKRHMIRISVQQEVSKNRVHPISPTPCLHNLALKWPLCSTQFEAKAASKTRNFWTFYLSFILPFLERFWMDNLYCEGHEKSLSECRFDGWGKSDCTEAEAAGVICESPETLIEEIQTPIKLLKIKIKVSYTVSNTLHYKQRD